MQRQKEKEEQERIEQEEKHKTEKKQQEAQHDLQMAGADLWTVNATVTIHHRRPRTKLYVPTQVECPIPLKYADVMQFTSTSLPEKKMKSIDGYWFKDGCYVFNLEWTGSARLSILCNLNHHLDIIGLKAG